MLNILNRIITLLGRVIVFLASIAKRLTNLEANSSVVDLSTIPPELDQLDKAMTAVENGQPIEQQTA